MSNEDKKMNNINPLFEKFKHIIPREVIIKEAFIKVFKNVFDKNIHKDHIDVRGKVIFLTISPLMKQEILYKKDEILKGLSTKIGEHSVVDVR